MSGYESGTTSTLGGGRPGVSALAFGNTTKGAENAIARLKLRKAFRTNRVSAAGNRQASCGPFRAAFNLGDLLSREYLRCGGSNQLYGTNSRIVSMAQLDGVSNADCGHTRFGATPLTVPLQSGNIRWVADESLYTEFKKLSAININYNDSTAGGAQNNQTFEFINRVRA